MADDSQAEKASGNSKLVQRIVLLGTLLAAIVGVIKYAKELGCLLKISCPPPVTVEITEAPERGSCPLGSTVALKAILKDENGSQLFGRSANWKSDKPGIVSVSEGGIATCKKLGDAIISANSGPVSDSVIFHVGHVSIREVTIAPPDKHLKVNEKFEFVAIARDSSGANVEASESSLWQVDDETVASVQSISALKATVSATAPGTTKVFVTIDGIIGTASLEVAAVPGQQPAPPAEHRRTATLVGGGALLPHITLVNGLPMGCSGLAKVKIDGQLTDLTIPGPQKTFLNSPLGTVPYNVSGSLECSGRRLNLSGYGQLTLSNGDSVRLSVSTNGMHPLSWQVTLAKYP